MKTINAWLKAARIPSQAYIFFPLLLGQLLAQSRPLSLPRILLVQVFGVLIQLFIVFANDQADYEADKENKTYTPFSGGSRVLVDNLLSRRSLGKATWIVTVGLLLFGILLHLSLDRPVSLLFVIFSMGLLWGYSYPPFKLSYQGGGELLQMLGVAVVLPLFGFYIHRGNLIDFPYGILLLLLPNHLGCAICTSLPDYPSDKRVGKKTASVLFGLSRAKQAVFLLNLLSLVFLWISPIPLPWKFRISVLPLLTTVLAATRTRALPGTGALLHFVFLHVLGVIAFLVGLCLFIYSTT